MRKAQIINEELEKYKSTIRENKMVKDRRKKDVENMLMTTMEILASH